MKFMMFALAACVALLAAPAQAGDHAKAMAPTGTVVEVAAANADFSTLVAAVKAAGLAETLGGPGPFTVFAPNDAAFANLPSGTLKDLLRPENRQKLSAILTYHVVPGKLMAADVARLDSAVTVNGKAAKIDTREGVRIDAANVIATDIGASNGVIHVIDRVLLP